jgi:hypothetical protein
MSECFQEAAMHADAERLTPLESWQAGLERALIIEFLLNQGHTMESLQSLSVADQNDLLRAAAGYASQRLAEIESRARYVDEIDR